MLPVIFGLAGPEITDAERQLFRDIDPVGFILFRRSITDPGQVRALTDSLRSLTGRDDTPILVDQEGGRVQRLQPPHWMALPAQARIGALQNAFYCPMTLSDRLKSLAFKGKLLPQFIRRGQVFKPCDVQVMNLIALCVCHSDSGIKKAGIMG